MSGNEGFKALDLFKVFELSTSSFMTLTYINRYTVNVNNTITATCMYTQYLRNMSGVASQAAIKLRMVHI